MVSSLPIFEGPIVGSVQVAFQPKSDWANAALVVALTASMPYTKGFRKDKRAEIGQGNGAKGKGPTRKG